MTKTERTFEEIYIEAHDRPITTEREAREAYCEAVEKYLNQLFENWVNKSNPSK